MQIDFERAVRDFFSQSEDVLWRKLGESNSAEYHYCEEGIYIVRNRDGLGRFEFCIYKAKNVAELQEMYYGKKRHIGEMAMSSEPKFTPWPWHIGEDEGFGIQLYDDDGNTIAYAQGRTLVQRKANAALLECAPKMYKMLDRIKGMLEFCKLENSIDAKTEYEIDALLKKARGEAEK